MTNSRLLSVLAVAAVATFLPPGAAAAQQGRGPSIEGMSDTTYGCVACHTDKRTAFVLGVHAERGIQCHNCHGGDPSAFTLPAAHRGGWVGTPNKIAIVALCGSCHSDPNQMRQYGLPAGEVAEFRTSRHGRLLLSGHDLNAPTCTDCHNAHTILRPDDARSDVHPTNILATCGRCHENQRLMAPYRLATDQVALFRKSAHGVALFQEQNFAAPTCVGCHGSHSALPPRGTEINNVCAGCHQLAGQAFNRGPHASATARGKLKGCLGCHSNHDTERVPIAGIAATCTRCHAAGTRAVALGEGIQRSALQASDDLRSADSAIQRLTLAGVQTGDARFRYQTALTAYLQIAEAQHTLDQERLDDLARRVGSIARDLRSMAEVAEERQWEHRLMLVPVWFLALASLALVWLSLRALEGRTPKG
jgi:hypothetical protein